MSNVCLLRAEFLIHHDPPFRTKSSHCPDDRKGTNPTYHAQSGEQPADPNCGNKGLSDNPSHTAEYIPYEIVHSYSAAAAFGHELCEHGRSHPKDDHASQAKEKVRDDGHNPDDAFLRSPPIPDQSPGEDRSRYPSIFSHSILRAEY